MTSHSHAPADGSSRHVPALWTLFATEAWERFSFYGMRALLVLYLVNKVGMERASALQIYATYTALVYLTPLIGGWLADKFLGSRKAVMIGGLVMALGHFAMAFPGGLFLGLALLIIGNGFFKPNVTTMVGKLYTKDDQRYDSAHTLFYVGINLGAALSGIVCGTLGQSVGWHWGFGAAGVGMVIGVIWLANREVTLGAIGLPPGRSEAGKLDSKDWVQIGWITGVSSLLAVVVIQLLEVLDVVWQAKALLGDSPNPLVLLAWQILMPLAVFGTLALVVQLAVPTKDSEQTLQVVAEGGAKESNLRRYILIGIGTFAMFIFFMGFEQAGGTMNLFADKKTDLSFLGFELKSTWFQSLNPFFIVMLGPFVFEPLWKRVGNKVPTLAKMAIGLLVLSLGFLLLAAAKSHSEEIGFVSPLWLVGAYFINTCAELCISPNALALVNRAAPTGKQGLMMAFLFIGIYAANYVAGTLESVLVELGADIDLWTLVAYLSAGAGVLLLVLVPLTRGWEGQSSEQAEAVH